MKISAAWLREYVPVPLDPAELAAFNTTLTMAGLEVEETFDSPDGVALYTKVTPNRGDWASVYGTAREAAAAASLPLAPYPGYAARVPGVTAPTDANEWASVMVESPLAPRFSLTVIRGVTVAPSPQWLQNRLLAAGMRPVNNIVDVTNYVMLETGQPLHGFDLATVPEGAITVRLARTGETLTTLDGVERTLDDAMLCICDAEKPIGIAGVMGGAATEITDATTDILLEAAHFDPLSVRRTAKRLGLRTEASYRFERYVDPLLVSAASERAAQLMTEIAGGAVARGGSLDVVQTRFAPRTVVARIERIRKLLGANVERDTLIAGLERLGISVERSAGAIDCVIPSWRPDLTMEDDIAEEVGRIALGYENLPETLVPVRSGAGSDSPKGTFTAFVRETLVRAGLQDCLTHSVVEPIPMMLDEARTHLAIRLPLTPQLSGLRTALLPNLLKIVATAHTDGIRDAAVFEIGSVYRREENGGLREPLHISGAITGSAVGQAWGVKPDAFVADFYYAKGVVETLLRALGVEATFAPGTVPNLHGGRTAQITAGGASLGYVGELSETAAQSNELPRRVYVFDLDGSALMARWNGSLVVRAAPLSKYPSVTRDLAPVFDVAVPFAEIEKAAREAAGELLESFALTDVYEGANLGDNKRALTLRFTFRSPDSTLTEAQITDALARVRGALETQTGAEFRG